MIIEVISIITLNVGNNLSGDINLTKLKYTQKEVALKAKGFLLLTVL